MMYFIDSIFPEKLIFDGEHHRTASVNEAMRVMFTIDGAFRQKENGTNLSFEDLSHLVNRIGFEPMACCLEGSCSIQLSYRSSIFIF